MIQRDYTPFFQQKSSSVQLWLMLSSQNLRQPNQIHSMKEVDEKLSKAKLCVSLPIQMLRDIKTLLQKSKSKQTQAILGTTFLFYDLHGKKKIEKQTDGLS